MNNYNKIGYSVPEVAQIFGCTPLTIRRYIYDGKLKADVSFANKRNNIRIRREHLIEYMREHRERFSKELLEQFKVIVDYSEAKATDNAADFAPGAYTAKDVSELAGAWGNGGAKPVNTKVKYSSSGTASVSKRPEVNPYSNIKREKKFPEYDIYANGKLVIGGCEKLTVGKIVDALVTDRQLNISDIQIKMK